MYDFGRGVQQDYAQAAGWFRKAAEQGFASAQLNLGAAYYEGQGVSQDYAQAAAWFRRAAEQGDATAQFNLGAAYCDGQGMPQDYTEAYFWLNLAALGKPEGIKVEEVVRMRVDAASHLSDSVLAHAQERARRWLEEHNSVTVLCHSRGKFRKICLPPLAISVSAIDSWSCHRNWKQHMMLPGSRPAVKVYTLTWNRRISEIGKDGKEQVRASPVLSAYFDEDQRLCQIEFGYRTGTETVGRWDGD